MSGISGCLNFKNNIHVERLHKMNSIIKHRGPDDEGFFLYDENDCFHAFGKDSLVNQDTINMKEISTLYNKKFQLGLGYRGLMINKTIEDYHQPMTYDNKTIVLNGNIYNKEKIKMDLEEQGIIFETNSDAEIIIKSYINWGNDCVKRFNGDWAFAIWDLENKRLFCSRDRIGIKPFYFYFDGNEFIFSSEIKQILEYGVKAEVNESVLFDFLFYGIDNYSNKTFFEKIYILNAGYNLEVEVNKQASLDLKTTEYWDIKNNLVGTNSFEESSEKIGESLKRSIKDRLYSDTGVGSCLSGGIDSSSIVTLACDELKNNGKSTNDFKTFTACYDDSIEVDERYYSDLIVNNLKCENIKIKPNAQKLKEDLEKIIWHQDEPFSGFGIFAGWCVMESASKNGIKILLDGQGGDETLLGYERYYAYKIKDKIKDFKLIDAMKEFKLATENSKLTKSMLFGFIIYFNNLYIRKLRLKKRNAEFLKDEFVSIYINNNEIDDLMKIRTLQDAKKDAIKQSISHLLRYEDRNTMAHSIESRVPFLDHEFVEIAFNESSEHKLRNGWTKANIRRFMEGKMPDEVTYRKEKLGFAVPKDKWIDELNDYFAEKLLKDPLSSKYLNIEFIKQIFKDKTHTDFRIKFIILELWLRTFFDPIELNGGE